MYRRRVRLASALVLVARLAGVSPAFAEDSREVKGRVLFAKGEYQAALDIYVTLFAEKGDRVYLRNIGRCYQKLHQPSKAIDSFQEYLRRSTRLKASERQEVEAFIKEMKALKAEQEAAAFLAPPPTSPPDKPGRDEPAAASTPAATLRPAPEHPPALLAGNDAGKNPSPPPLVDKTPEGGGAAPPDESRPVTRRWWFWTGMGVIGAVVTALVLRAGTNRPSCDMGFTCL